MLTENSQQIDAGYFSDFGFGYSQTTLEFSFEEYVYVFTGHSNLSTRVGAISNAVNIEIKKFNDRAGKPLLSVGAFKASHIFDKFGAVKGTVIELAIVSSECQVTAPSKQ